MRDVVALRVGLQVERAAALEDRVARLLSPLGGDERVLDAGCGAGAFAYAVAGRVGSVVGVDMDSALLAAAREHAPPNATFVEADVMDLPFGYGEFDIVGCVRVLHHVRRPEVAMQELSRVLRPGGTLLVVDQLGSVDPIRSLEIDRFERERDPSHQRLLPDTDVRGYIDANDLTVSINEITAERRDMERYIALAGLEGEDAARVLRMAPAAAYDVEIGWYVARKLS